MVTVNSFPNYRCVPAVCMALRDAVLCLKAAVARKKKERCVYIERRRRNNETWGRVGNVPAGRVPREEWEEGRMGELFLPIKVDILKQFKAPME